MGFFRYIRAAFSARPWGMPIPPNWIALAAFALLGLLEPGLWAIGAGLELAYLLMLSNSTRFCRLVDGAAAAVVTQSAQQQTDKLLARLSAADQNRFTQLQRRCENLLQQQHELSPTDLQTQADGLGRLAYVYLRLLATRAGILRVVSANATQSIDVRISDVQAQLKSASTPELQKSLSDQLDILGERKKRHAEARDKLAFIEAELTRIEEQVELIREGLAVSPDAAALSRRIDAVGNTLGATTNWIRQQQEILGDTEDLLNDPPPVALKVPQAQ